MLKYQCPFCNIQLSKKEMQFHVGIPLCMEQRTLTSPNAELPHPIEKLRTPVSPLYLEYFGVRGMKNLLSEMIRRMGYGTSQEPLELEKYVDHSEDV